MAIEHFNPADIAGLTFQSEANKIRLDDLPDNDEAALRGRTEAMWMRASAVILQDDDKELFAKFKDTESADCLMTLAEGLGKYIQGQRAGLQVMEAAQSRLMVCASRYAASFDAPNGGAA